MERKSVIFRRSASSSEGRPDMRRKNVQNVCVVQGGSIT
jgi:hypothetical protein